MTLNTQTLLRFGLHPVEVECYLALLTQGSATVSDIAKRTGKGRSLVYFHVKHLKERGFIEESRKKTILRYVPKPASAVMDIIQSWADAFREQIPLLESLQRIDTETPTIQVSESKRGYTEIYEEISALPTGSVFRILEGKTAMQGELGILPARGWNRFFERIIERRIITKAIFTETSLATANGRLSEASTELARKRLWDLRVIHEANIPFQNMLMIYGEKVAFAFPDTALVVTLKHPRIAQSLQIMFDGLFSLGRPRKNPFEE